MNEPNTFWDSGNDPITDPGLGSVRSHHANPSSGYLGVALDGGKMLFKHDAIIASSQVPVQTSETRCMDSRTTSNSINDYSSNNSEFHYTYAQMNHPLPQLSGANIHEQADAHGLLSYQLVAEVSQTLEQGPSSIQASTGAYGQEHMDFSSFYLQSGIADLLNKHLDLFQVDSIGQQRRTQNIFHFAQLARNCVGTWESCMFQELSPGTTLGNELSPPGFSGWNVHQPTVLSRIASDIDMPRVAETVIEHEVGHLNSCNDVLTHSPAPNLQRKVVENPSPLNDNHAKKATLSLPCVLPDCTISSESSYDWKRHQSAHYPRWTCMLYDTSTIGEFCAICGVGDTSEAHKRSHPRLTACLAKAKRDRSFRGRDKLCDHLQVHLGLQELSVAGIAKRKALLAAWASDSALSGDAFWCGFCQITLASWEERQERILQHLKDGEELTSWRATCSD